MNTIPVLLFASTLLFTQACSSLQPSGSKVLMIDKSNSRVVTFSGNLRGAYFIDKNSNVKFCSEPAPDVARESFRELSATLKANVDPTKSLDATAHSRLEAKALELAGRTELLLVAREMLYRACELSLNNEIDQQGVLRLYTNVAELIRSLALKDQQDAQKDLLETQERVMKAKKNAAKAFE